MPDYALPDGSVPVLISADTPELVQVAAQDLLSYLRANPAAGVQAVAATLLRTRPARAQRALCWVRDGAELAETLQALIAGTGHDRLATAAAAGRRVGLVFPGQGGQRPGMGAMFYRLSLPYRRAVDNCDAAFERVFAWSPMSYVVSGVAEREQVSLVQPALFMHMAGLANMWMEAGLSPAAMIGHSQGEIAAAYLSGVISLDDAIRVVTQRARDVEKHSPKGHSMGVLGISREECAALLARESGWAELSVINSPHLLCISGTRGTVLRVMEKVAAQAKFAREIRVDYPAHTSVVSQFASELQTMLGADIDSDSFAGGTIPCIGATLGAAITPDIPLREYWFWNLRNVVRFDLAIAAALGQGIDSFIEIADHPALLLAIGENISVQAADATALVCATSRRGAGDLTEFTRSLVTVALHDISFDWRTFDRDPAGPAGLPLAGFPHSPMAAHALWAVAANELAAGHTAAAGQPQYLREKWIPLSQRTLSPPASMVIVDPGGGHGELAAGLAGAAERFGTGAQLVPVAGLAASRADCCVILAPALPLVDGTTAVDQLAALFASRDWIPGPGQFADCWLVTIGGEIVTPAETTAQIALGALASGYRSIAAGRPGERLRHVDIEPETAAVELMSALCTPAEPELAVRSGQVWAKRLAEAASPEASCSAAGMHTLITGGTGELGLEIAGHYARAGASRITLLSRTGETPQVSARLRPLREQGTPVLVRRCDITNADQVAALARELEGAPIDTVIHAAVHYISADLGTVDAGQVQLAGAAKVAGLELLVRLLPLHRDTAVLLCSSLAATIGGRGQLLYAMANRALELTGARLRAQGRNCVAVQWGLWSVQGVLDDGAHADTMQAGARPMPPPVALAGLACTTDTIVASMDWPRLRTLLELFGQAPLLAELGVAAVTAPIGPAAGDAAPVSGMSVAQLLRRELNLVLGNAAGGPIDDSAPLVALGLDSLQALDFRKRIRLALGQDLPVAAVLGGASLREVTDLLARGAENQTTPDRSHP